MEKLLIVDGSNLLFQMFYGMPSRIVNKEGKAIHGTVGFIGALLKTVCMNSPTHVVVLFDGEHHNDRKEVDEAYKANRPDFSLMPEEETPFSQLPDIYRALDFLKIKHTETTVCETDDLIASYALQYGDKMQIVISSFDSDFFQLITPNVKIWRYRGEKSQLCGEDYVREKYDVSPCAYADFKCLVGDTADNIKGADKIGVKTAAKLLNAFGSLEGIMQNIDQIGQAGVRSSLQSAKERLQKNRLLIVLNAAQCVPFSLDELAYTNSGVTTGEVLRAIGLK